MSDALTFNGPRSLDFCEIRSSVIRIPEILSRAREVQKSIDRILGEPFDLINFIGDEFSAWTKRPHVAAIGVAVVQLGLLDRYLKSNPSPDYLLGPSSGIALHVAGGDRSLDQSVRATLSGVRTTSSEVFDFSLYGRRGESADYVSLPVRGMGLDALMTEWLSASRVQRLILLGPGDEIFGPQRIASWRGRIEVVETIGLDSSLDWFWPQVRGNKGLAAN